MASRQSIRAKSTSPPKSREKPSPPQIPQIVKLNFGGQLFETTFATLGNFGENFLTQLCLGNVPSYQDANGYFFIDRSGTASLIQGYNSRNNIRSSSWFPSYWDPVHSISHPISIHPSRGWFLLHRPQASILGSSIPSSLSFNHLQENSKRDSMSTKQREASNSSTLNDIQPILGNSGLPASSMNFMGLTFQWNRSGGRFSVFFVLHFHFRSCSLWMDPIWKDLDFRFQWETRIKK